MKEGQVAIGNFRREQGVNPLKEGEIRVPLGTDHRRHTIGRRSQSRRP
jgi:hypothetical protein